MNLEECLLTSKFLCLIIFRESNINFYIIAGRLANELIFESIDEAVRTENEVIVLTLAAFECLIINESFEVDVSGILQLSCAVNLNGTCVAVSLSFDFLINIFVTVMPSYLPSFTSGLTATSAVKTKSLPASRVTILISG